MAGIRRTDVKGISGGNPVCSVHPQSPAVTAPVGHTAPLRCAGTCAASVPMPGTSLTLRCGPEGPSHLNPQSLRDSPLLRGATPIHPLAGGPVAGHRPAP